MKKGSPEKIYQTAFFRFHYSFLLFVKNKIRNFFNTEKIEGKREKKEMTLFSPLFLLCSPCLKFNTGYTQPKKVPLKQDLIIHYNY